MYKPNFTLGVNAPSQPLPKTFIVENYDVCVSDVSISALCNVPKSTIIVHADGSVYDISIDATHC